MPYYKKRKKIGSVNSERKKEVKYSTISNVLLITPLQQIILYAVEMCHIFTTFIFLKN